MADLTLIAVLAITTGIVIFHMKKGKNKCGGCGCCPMAGSCGKTGKK